MINKTINFRDKELLVTCINNINIEDALNFKPTIDWLNKIENNKELFMDELEFREIYYCNKEVIFVSWLSKIRNHNLTKEQWIDKYGHIKGYYLPDYVFCKNNSICIFPILSCEENNELYTILIEKTHIPIADTKKNVLACGYISNINKNIISSDFERIKEELGFENLNNYNLVDLGSLAWSGESKLSTSSLITNEHITVYAFHKKIKLNNLRKKNNSNNKKVKIVYLDDLWGLSRDSKTLSAYCLYQNLVKYKSIDKKLNKLRPQYSSCSCSIN